MARYSLLFLSLFFYFIALGQLQPIYPLTGHNPKYCFSMEALQEVIKKNPGIENQWRKKGEQLYQQFLLKESAGIRVITDTVIIPVVFHLVDESSKLGWIPDRSMYDQLRLLNEAYNGVKARRYEQVIPKGIYSRTGEIPLKFVLARRAPDGSLTSGIERRVNTTPDRVSIKYDTAGGMNAWNTDKYLNIWVGSFAGKGDDFLGAATFPFLTTEMIAEGPQGVVIDIATLPFTTNVSRSYYPTYAEGVTLIHEMGHYFYLYHTHGDEPFCNNDDFQTEPGWPLSSDAGIAGDDTPPEKFDDNTSFGNISMNFTDGCAPEPIGAMYGSFMNYYDDRSLFMFSNGHKNRVLDCIQRYRPDLANSNGAFAPVSVNDAYIVTAAPYGTPESRSFIRSNTPFSIQIMNYGNTTLNSVQLTVSVDGGIVYQQNQTVNLAPGASREINIGSLNIPSGNKQLIIYTSKPNGTTDAFTANDTLQNFVTVINSTVSMPYVQNFGSSAFPPTGWALWNPNGDATWTYNNISGYPAAGSATMQFRNNSGAGQLDELIMPAINTGSADSVTLSFQRAYALYNNTVTGWDGLEVCISNDEGRNYQLIFKKTGDKLRTTPTNQTTPFQALPSEPAKWIKESIDLTPFITSKPLLIKFRATNASGNNLYLDDIRVFNTSAFNRDAEVTSINQIPLYVCENMPSPTVGLLNNGKNTLTKVTLNYQINGGQITRKDWTGSLNTGDSATVTLDKLPDLIPGEYEIKVFSSDPNGLADEFPDNDTARYQFYVMGKATTPVTESFEGSAFPPDQWVLQSSGNGHSWIRTGQSSFAGSASAEMNNYQYDMGGGADNLISPVISTDQPYDSLFLSLNYAYAPGANYPGARGEAEDTLEVRITTDCGSNFTSLFKKSGKDLVTVADPNGRKNNPFIAGKVDWDSLRFYLTPLTGNSKFQIFITSRGNHRNNLYIDNIQVSGINVPPLLKEKGYLFYPSPFRDQFVIRHFEQPEDLKSIRIFNTAGQLIWHSEFNGTASKMIYVNSSGWARGIYMVRLNYTSHEVTDKIVKQ